jgi:hypothetical protein
MSLMTIGEFLHKVVPHHLPTQGLTGANQQHVADVERIARTLAHQNNAPDDAWPMFVEPAETMIRLSRRWAEVC